MESFSTFCKFKEKRMAIGSIGWTAGRKLIQHLSLFLNFVMDPMRYLFCDVCVANHTH